MPIWLHEYMVTRITQTITKKESLFFALEQKEDIFQCIAEN